MFYFLFCCLLATAVVTLKNVSLFDPSVSLFDQSVSLFDPSVSTEIENIQTDKRNISDTSISRRFATFWDLLPGCVAKYFPDLQNIFSAFRAFIYLFIN